MKLVSAPIVPVSEDDRLKELELRAKMAQGRLMIAQLAKGLREAQKELTTLEFKKKNRKDPKDGPQTK